MERSTCAFAHECLRAWYGKPKKNAFDDETIGIDEGNDKVDAEAEVDVEIAIDARGDGEVIQDITSR